MNQRGIERFVVPEPTRSDSLVSILRFVLISKSKNLTNKLSASSKKEKRKMHAQQSLHQGQPVVGGIVIKIPDQLSTLSKLQLQAKRSFFIKTNRVAHSNVSNMAGILFNYGRY